MSSESSQLVEINWNAVLERTEKFVIPDWKKKTVDLDIWFVESKDYLVKFIKNYRISTISVDIPLYVFNSWTLSITDVVIVTGQDRNYVTFATNVPRKMYLFTLLRSVVSENLRRIAFYSSTNNRRTQRQFLRNRYAQQLCLLFAYGWVR